MNMQLKASAKRFLKVALLLFPSVIAALFGSRVYCRSQEEKYYGIDFYLIIPDNTLLCSGQIMMSIMAAGFLQYISYVNYNNYLFHVLIQGVELHEIGTFTDIVDAPAVYGRFCRSIHHTTTGGNRYLFTHSQE